jgi:hypothetical protein
VSSSTVGGVNTDNYSIVAYGQRPKDVGTTKEASPESPTAESVGSPGKTESEGSPPKV